ncbi:hypothetical protein [Enterococcus cecorum]
MTKKDGSLFSVNEWTVFDEIISDFFEKLEVEFIQEKEIMEE